MNRHAPRPNTDAFLARWATRLGPQRTAAHLLSHLGDAEIYKPFAPGDEPTWLETLCMLLIVNSHITVDDVMANLRAKIEAKVIPIASRRRRTRA